jgi:hypothetical protein
MTKFSSFKEQQLLTEGWRTYMVEQQPISQPPQQQQAQPQDKELQNFQQRQSAVTTVNKDIIAKKAIEYIKTLRGFDLEKNKQVVIDGLTMVIKQLQTPQQAQPVKESIYEGAHLDDGTLVCEACLEELLENQRTIIQEAKYQGRTVTLNKPTKGDVKKFKVYVKDPSTGNIKKVNFGDPNMKIKKNIPARRKSFRARHNCANPGPKTKARYWSCKKW